MNSAFAKIVIMSVVEGVTMCTYLIDIIANKTFSVLSDHLLREDEHILLRGVPLIHLPFHYW